MISPDEMRWSDGVGDSADIVPYLQRVVGSVKSSLIERARVSVLVSEVPLGSSSLYLSFRGKNPENPPDGEIRHSSSAAPQKSTTSTLKVLVKSFRKSKIRLYL